MHITNEVHNYTLSMIQPLVFVLLFIKNLKDHVSYHLNFCLHEVEDFWVSLMIYVNFKFCVLYVDCIMSHFHVILSFSMLITLCILVFSRWKVPVNCEKAGDSWSSFGGPIHQHHDCNDGPKCLHSSCIGLWWKERENLLDRRQSQ